MNLNVMKYNKREKIHFFINIVIGVSIAIFISFFEQTKRGEIILDAFIDKMVNYESYVIKNSNKNTIGIKIGKLLVGKSMIAKYNENDIIFIDLDRCVLGDKYLYPVIPRGLIANTLNKISKFNPKIIVVDILFDFYGCPKEKELENTIDKILSAHNIILVFPADIDPQTHCILYPYFYKKLKKKHPKKIFVASPNFEASNTDGIARFMNFYQIGLDKKSGHKKILWNIAFLSEVLKRNSIEEAKEKLEKAKQELLGKNKKKVFFNLCKNHNILITNNNLILNRIRFPYSIILKNTVLDRDNKIIYPDYITSKIQNTLVILGTTDLIRNDYHVTPIGLMPGMALIGNGIKSIDTMQLKKEGLIIKYLIRIFVIIIAAYLFLWFDSLLALILSVIFIGLLLPIGLYLFYHNGIVLNIALPIMGIAIHKYIADFRKIFRNNKI